MSLLFEAPEPFLDATRGRTNADVLLSGRDEFVVKAGKKGLLFAPIDDKGWPMALWEIAGAAPDFDPGTRPAAHERGDVLAPSRGRA